MAHTGAISGGAAALDGLLAPVGAIRVDDLDEFRETLLLFSVTAPRRTASAPGSARCRSRVARCGLIADMAEAWAWSCRRSPATTTC